MVTTLLLWCVAFLLVTAGLAGLILPLLPGAPLLFLGLVVAAWAEHFVHVGAGTLGVLAVLALATYGVDLLAGALGARHFGASRRAVAGAALGAVLGLALGPVGLIAGPFLGAAAGELSQQRSLRTAGRSGLGATVGLLIGAAGKLGLAGAMLGIFLLARLA